MLKAQNLSAVPLHYCGLLLGPRPSGMGGARVALGVVLFWLHRYGVCSIWLVLGVVLRSCSHSEGLKSPLAPQEQRRRWSWRHWLCGWCERRLVVHHLFEFCFFPRKFSRVWGSLSKAHRLRVKPIGGRDSRPIKAHSIGVRVARPIGAKRVPKRSTCHKGPSGQGDRKTHWSSFLILSDRPFEREKHMVLDDLDTLVLCITEWSTTS